MSQPLVSVVVPTFRRGQYLRQALDSAVGQTFRDIEVIVSDDGSPELYADAVLAGLGDGRVRLRRNRTNLGQAGNNRAAFAECRGTFIANLHDDDMWEPTFLERLTAPLVAHPDVAMAFCDHWVMDADDRVDPAATDANSARWGRPTLAPGRHQPFLDLAVVRQSVPVAMAAVWRRAAVPWAELPPEVNAAYDLFLGYLAARDGAAAWYVPERLTRYRVHASSATAGRGTSFSESNVTARRLMLADGRTSAQHAALREALAGCQASLGLDLLAAGRTAEARPHLWASVRRRPAARSAVGLLLSSLPAGLARRLVRRLRATS